MTASFIIIALIAAFITGAVCYAAWLDRRYTLVKKPETKS